MSGRCRYGCTTAGPRPRVTSSLSAAGIAESMDRICEEVHVGCRVLRILQQHYGQHGCPLRIRLQYVWNGFVTTHMTASRVRFANFRDRLSAPTERADAGRIRAADREINAPAAEMVNYWPVFAHDGTTANRTTAWRSPVQADTSKAVGYTHLSHRFRGPTHNRVLALTARSTHTTVPVGWTT